MYHHRCHHNVHCNRHHRPHHLPQQLGLVGCGLLHYHYLITILSLSYHDHNYIDSNHLIIVVIIFPPQLGLVGCVRDLVVEGSSIGLAEVSPSS